MTRTIRTLLLILALAGAAYAQNDGQFCVRAFEDRNANQLRDQDEPLLEGGLGADLSDESGVVVASALLDDSPNADRGIICFQFLSPGQYTLHVTSAEFRATTPDTMTVTLVGGELPAVMEFGGQSIAAALEPSPETLPESEPQIERLVAAGIGALVALLVMQMLGLVIYVVRFRRRQPVVADAKVDTGRFRRPAE
jgi:hypothetical protein